MRNTSQALPQLPSLVACSWRSTVPQATWSGLGTRIGKHWVSTNSFMVLFSDVSSLGSMHLNGIVTLGSYLHPSKTCGVKLADVCTRTYTSKSSILPDCSMSKKIMMPEVIASVPLTYLASAGLLYICRQISLAISLKMKFLSSLKCTPIWCSQAYSLSQNRTRYLMIIINGKAHACTHQYTYTTN